MQGVWLLRQKGFDMILKGLDTQRHFGCGQHGMCLTKIQAWLNVEITQRGRHDFMHGAGSRITSIAFSLVCIILVLVAARKQATSEEILLWMTPSEAPKALQASECSELLDPTGASCWIFAQR